MPENQEEQKQPEGEIPQKVKYENIEVSYPTIYINNAEFGTTEWDINLTLSEINKANVETNTLGIVPRVRIVMSVPFAVRFVEVMKRTLDTYMKTVTQQLEKQQQPSAPPKSDSTP